MSVVVAFLKVVLSSLSDLRLVKGEVIADGSFERKEGMVQQQQQERLGFVAAAVAGRVLSLSRRGLSSSSLLSSNTLVAWEVRLSCCRMAAREPGWWEAMMTMTMVVGRKEQGR